MLILERIEGVYKGDRWTFTGEMMNGIPHGKGRVEYTDGRIFTGYMYNEMIEGMGEMKWVNEDTYRSRWINGKMEGYYERELPYLDRVEKGCRKGGEWHGPGYTVNSDVSIIFCMCENGDLTGHYFSLDGEKIRLDRYVKRKDNGEESIFALEMKENTD